MSLKSSLEKQLAFGPRTAKELRGSVGTDIKRVKKALAELEAEKRVRLKKGAYSLVGQPPEVVEASIAKLGKNFAFAHPADGSGDVFIPGHLLLGAMPGDTVKVAISRHPRVAGSREGEVVAVAAPQNNVTGTVRVEGGRLALVPDNARDTWLLIKRSATGGVQEGEKAAGVISERGDSHAAHRVCITMRFGNAESAKQCALAILYGAGVEKQFPPGVKDEARKMPAAILKQDTKQRLDLRDEVIFTIDSDSTKDIDDAISARKMPEGFALGVHIADVSHYVRPKMMLDDEAAKRGTSIYYADNVIPMLPRQLSNGICSLNPCEDRLAFSCLMHLSDEGELLDYEFKKTVIRSRVKGVYTELNALADGTADEGVRSKYADVRAAFTVMLELYEKLAARRAERGCFDIESDEPKFVINEDGVCVDVQKRTRGLTERMIEEFMLMANTAAAKLAKKLDIPFVYRVHERPAQEKIDNLKALLGALKVEYNFQGDVPTQREIAKLLDETRDTNLEIPVHTGVLRSMMKAKYEPEPRGHFGLALADYAHFTSPIRRYPDLAIHRILSDVACGVDVAEIRRKYGSFAAKTAQTSTETEMRAQNAERSCDDCYAAEYMRGHIGGVFDGVITSVVSFGIYVTLPNTVEGLIHVTHLSPEHMEFTEGVSLRDPVGGRLFRLGDPLCIKVAACDVSQGKIDYILAD